MLPLSTKITIGIIMIICWLIAYVSAHSKWYSNCLNVPKGVGTFITLLPLITVILILILLGLKILSWEYSDEFFMVGTVIGSILLIVSIVQQFRGKCSPKCENKNE